MHLIIKCIKHSLNVFTGNRTASVGQDLVFELFCQLRNVHNVNKQGGYQNNMVHFTTYHSLVISFSKKKTWIFNLCRLAFKTGLWFNSGLVEATTNSAVINENNLLFVFFLGGEEISYYIQTTSTDWWAGHHRHYWCSRAVDQLRVTIRVINHIGEDTGD